MFRFLRIATTRVEVETSDFISSNPPVDVAAALAARGRGDVGRRGESLGVHDMAKLTVKARAAIGRGVPWGMGHRSDGL
ncbi:MAG TPA: hypothetical protein VFS57_05565 [Gemmatimonadaceae bacterium]|nr:hypothetical protein [Gemmatimonadaceae bacterium]